VSFTERSRAVSPRGSSQRPGTALGIAALGSRFILKEWRTKMCWEMDYQFWAEQKKAQAQKEREQRAGVIDQLLSDATRQAEKPVAEDLPVKEAAPAK
jgi:hypothetical protein